MTENRGKPLGNVVQIDEGRIRDYLGELVRGTVEETPNGMLDAEADAQRYERSPERNDYPAGVSVRRVEDITLNAQLDIDDCRGMLMGHFSPYLRHIY